MRTERLFSGMNPSRYLRPGTYVRIQRTNTPELQGVEGLVLRVRGLGQVSVRTSSGLTITTDTKDLEVITK